MKFDEICKLLEEDGFSTTSIEGALKRVYVNEDKSLCITIEEKDIGLSAEDEKRIQERLRALGYMD